MIRFLAGLILLGILCPDSNSQDSGIGAGLVLGEPTGLSGKAWLDHQTALDAGLAWSFKRPGFLHIHADYLVHFPGTLRGRERLLPYLGIGVRALGGRHDDEAMIGVRIPAGLVWLPRDVPLDVFIEGAPILDLIPASRLRFNLGLGARWFFSNDQ